jgi:OmpA-OmpF porin, OOP family
MKSITRIGSAIVASILLSGHGVRTPAQGEELYAPRASAYTPRLGLVDNYRVFFEYDRADLTPAAHGILKTLKANANGAWIKRIIVRGHTSTIGSSDHNLQLSQRRAEAVKFALLELTVQTDSIVTEARGEADLLVPTANDVREPQNNRVELTLER